MLSFRSNAQIMFEAMAYDNRKERIASKDSFDLSNKPLDTKAFSKTIFADKAVTLSFLEKPSAKKIDADPLYAIMKTVFNDYLKRVENVPEENMVIALTSTAYGHGSGHPRAYLILTKLIKSIPRTSGYSKIST